jgi:hypothetical protein
LVVQAASGIITGAAKHGNWNEAEKRLPLPPQMNLREIIRPHQPNKACLGECLAQGSERIDGITGSQFGFESGRHYRRLVREQAPRRPQAARQRSHAGGGLEWVLGTDQPPDFIEPQMPKGIKAHLEMALMRGVKRAAQKANRFMGVARRVARVGINHRLMDSQNRWFCYNRPHESTPIPSQGARKE